MTLSTPTPRAMGVGFLGAVSLAWLWKKHRIVGFLLGAAIGSALYDALADSAGAAAVSTGASGFFAGAATGAKP